MSGIIQSARYSFTTPCGEFIQYSAFVLCAGVPGGYNSSVKSLIPVVATSVWITQPAQKREPHRYCSSGYIVHGICIMTNADLFRVRNDLKVNVSSLRGPIFYNKYFMERDHTVMDCVEEQLIIRNKLEHKKECLA